MTISFLEEVGPESAAPVLARLSSDMEKFEVRNPSAYVTRALSKLPRPEGTTWGNYEQKPITAYKSVSKLDLTPSSTGFSSNHLTCI